MPDGEEGAGNQVGHPLRLVRPVDNPVFGRAFEHSHPLLPLSIDWVRRWWAPAGPY